MSANTTRRRIAKLGFRTRKRRAADRDTTDATTADTAESTPPPSLWRATAAVVAILLTATAGVLALTAAVAYIITAVATP